jgi:hypothetical protein
MDCGQGNLFCDIQHWLTVSIIWISDALQYAVDQFNLLVDWIRSQLKELIAIGSLALAIWKWWRYRENVLHRRLAEYLTEQDHRLKNARDDVLQAIFRPGRRRAFNEPVFAARSLRDVLRRRRWDSKLGLRKIERNAEHKLDRALNEIDHRLGITVAALTSLRAQMASAYVLKGAIASARASQTRNPVSAMDLDAEALVHFRTALQVHDYERDVQAKEYEAHQLRKLGHLAEAESAYEQLEAFTAWIADERVRHLAVARARRYRAQIAQANAVGGSNDARNLIVEALEHRSLFGPYRDWEGIEQGDVHYIEAFIRCRLGHAQIEKIQLGQAARAYGRVLRCTHPSGSLRARQDAFGQSRKPV